MTLSKGEFSKIYRSVLREDAEFGKDVEDMDNAYASYLALIRLFGEDSSLTTILDDQGRAKLVLRARSAQAKDVRPVP